VTPPPEPGAFDAARRETVRYHEELYASTALGQPGSWLARPHRLLRDALGRVRGRGPVVAYDLGAGIGRHTVPMLRALPPGSEVYAVDLLPSALERLEAAVPPELRGGLHLRAADLDTYELEASADLVLAFSALEHLPGRAAVGRALARVRDAMRPGGVVAVGIVADRAEVDAAGISRPARVETALTAAEAQELLDRAFRGFTVELRDASTASVREERGGAAHTLTSTLVTWVATAPPDPAAPQG